MSLMSGTLSPFMVINVFLFHSQKDASRRCASHAYCNSSLHFPLQETKALLPQIQKWSANSTQNLGLCWVIWMIECIHVHYIYLYRKAWECASPARMEDFWEPAPMVRFTVNWRCICNWNGQQGKQHFFSNVTKFMNPSSHQSFSWLHIHSGIWTVKMVGGANDRPFRSVWHSCPSDLHATHHNFHQHHLWHGHVICLSAYLHQHGEGLIVCMMPWFHFWK